MSKSKQSEELKCQIDGKTFKTIEAKNKHIKLMHPEQVFKTGINQDIKDKPALQLEIVEKDQIPKTVRRRTGAYSLIEEKLKELKDGQAISFVVEKRTQAGGYLKYFKDKGYDVVSRSVENGIRVYIGKGLKSSD
jgi:ribosomal protein L21E